MVWGVWCSSDEGPSSQQLLAPSRPPMSWLRAVAITLSCLVLMNLDEVADFALLIKLLAMFSWL